MSLLPALAPWQQRAYDKACAAIEDDRFGHATLVVGPEGIGKRLMAEHLGQWVLCANRIGYKPCGQCRSCHLYTTRAQRDPLELRPDKSLAHPDGHPSHPDALFLGYAWKFTPSPPKQLTQVVVDQIRDLTERLGKTPQFGGAQVVIIDPADGMNESAFNALLKTLEEPQPGRYLWLLSSSPARLPATIRSRCQRLELRLPPRDEALQWLGARGHHGELAREALDAARGHPGLADAWASGDGLALRRAVAQDLQALQRGQAAAAELAQRWVADGRADERLAHVAELALQEAANLTDPARTRTLAARFDAANRTRNLLRSTVRADLAVTEALLGWVSGRV